jgi:hypothetical protein
MHIPQEKECIVSFFDIYIDPLSLTPYLLQHFIYFCTRFCVSQPPPPPQRTASDISAAYEKRQALKALEPQLEGLEAWIFKVKNYYFFGFFEGETGQQAPWYLRPSITFPIAFAVVALTFWFSTFVGAISERGAAVTDELDDIILSSSATSTAMMAMLMSMSTTPMDM